MRWTRWVAWGSLAWALVGVLFALSCTSSETRALSHMRKLARGEYLTWICGCNYCHTPGGMYGMPDTTRLLAGSDLGWEGPWGVTYAPNLTPDEESGILVWTKAEIIASLRKAHRPDDSPLLPPMSWQSFERLTDEDADALATYLKSIRPVFHMSPGFAPPETKPTGQLFTLPPPTSWDTPRTPPAGDAR